VVFELFISRLSLMTKLSCLPDIDYINQKSSWVYARKSNKSQAVIAKYAVPILVFFGLLIFIFIYLGVRKSTKHFQSKFRYLFNV